MKRILLLVWTFMALSAIPLNAQQYKMQTPIPPGVAIPDKVETRSAR